MSNNLLVETSLSCCGIMVRQPMLMLSTDKSSRCSDQIRERHLVICRLVQDSCSTKNLMARLKHKYQAKSI